MQKPRPAQTSTCVFVFTATGEAPMATEQVSEGGGSDPGFPVTLNHATAGVKEQRGNGALSPGVCVALELLFDVPEEVVLGQEEWGAQSQELPALQGTGSVG